MRVARNVRGLAILGLRDSETDFPDILPPPVIGNAVGGLSEMLVSELAEIERRRLGRIDRLTNLPGAEIHERRAAELTMGVALPDAGVNDVKPRPVRNAVRQAYLAAD